MLKSELRVGQIFTIVEKSEELGDNAVSVVICRILHYVDAQNTSQVSSVCYTVCQGQSRFLENATIYTINPTFFIENYGAGLVKPEVVEPNVVTQTQSVVFEVGNAQIQIQRYMKFDRLVINMCSKDDCFDVDHAVLVQTQDRREISRQIYTMVSVLVSEGDITEDQAKDTTTHLVNMFRLFAPHFEITSTL